MLGQCCAGWVQATKPLCYGSVKISFCLKIPSFVATDRDRISYEFSLKISTDVMPTNTEETVFNCLLTSPHIPPWKSAHIHVRWMLYNTYCGNVSVVCSDFTCQRLILAAAQMKKFSLCSLEATSVSDDGRQVLRVFFFCWNSLTKFCVLKLL